MCSFHFVSSHLRPYMDLWVCSSDLNLSPWNPREFSPPVAHGSGGDGGTSSSWGDREAQSASQCKEAVSGVQSRYDWDILLTLYLIYIYTYQLIIYIYIVVNYILYYTILYYIILYYIHIILYYIILYYIILVQSWNSDRLWYTGVSRVDFMSSPAPHIAQRAAGAARDFLFLGCWKDWEGGRHDQSRHSFNTEEAFLTQEPIFSCNVPAARLLCCGKQTKTTCEEKTDKWQPAFGL